MMILDMTNDEYHRSPQLGASGLKLLDKSPLHFITRPQSESKSFTWGTAWHCALFEPSKFFERFAESSGERGNSTKAVNLEKLLSGEKTIDDFVEAPSLTTKAGKEICAALIKNGKVPVLDKQWYIEEFARLNGKEILAKAEIEEILQSVERIKAHPLVNEILNRDDCIIEPSIFHYDKQLEIEFKIRPDLMILPCEDYPNGLIVDGKSTKDASPEGFKREIWKYGYGLQAALYTKIFQLEFKTELRPDFYLWPCEKNEPFANSVHVITSSDCNDDETINVFDYFDEKIIELVKTYKHCIDTKQWPGYTTDKIIYTLPSFVKSDEKVEVEYV